MKRKIIIIVLVAVVIAAGIGYYLYSKKTPDIVNDKADIEIKASDLIAAFEKDTAAARKVYLDKIIAVTGTVKTVDTAGGVVLGEANTESAVVCGLDRRHLLEAHSLKPGSSATLQGRCTGYAKGEEMMGISLGTTIQLAFAGIKKKE